MTPVLQACLNGGRPPGAHPALPLTPADLAADLAACLKAGAGEAHLHPRGMDGAESVAAADMAAAVAAVRPLGAPFGVSTQAGIAAPKGISGGMAASVAAWTEAPDYASVNLHEPAAPAVRRALAARGVGVEAGIWTVEDVARLADGPASLRILIEVQATEPQAALAEADAILSALDRVDPVTPRLLHGLEGSAWPLLRRAQALGLSARIGFEDVLVGEDGRPAPSNAALVAQALGGG